MQETNTLVSRNGVYAEFGRGGPEAFQGGIDTKSMFFAPKKTVSKAGAPGASGINVGDREGRKALGAGADDAGGNEEQEQLPVYVCMCMLL